MNRRLGVTLLELTIAVSLLGVIALALTSIQSFSQYHAIGSDRRAKVQNELSFVLEHIAKNVQRATGDYNNPPIQAITNGFRVRVDDNATPTPSTYTDDTWYSYVLSGYSLSCNGEVLSTRIVSGVNSNYPTVSPANTGFNYGLPDSGMTSISVMLRGRYYPADSVNIDNPETMMGSRFSTASSASK
jgi:Tfp pilus assembly protein PilV